MPLWFWFSRPTSHLCIIAEGAGLVNPVLLQQLLIPGTAVQRVSKTQELPGEEDEQSVNKNKQMEKEEEKNATMFFCRVTVDELMSRYWTYTGFNRHVISLDGSYLKWHKKRITNDAVFILRISFMEKMSAVCREPVKAETRQTTTTGKQKETDSTRRGGRQERKTGNRLTGGRRERKTGNRLTATDR